KRAEEKRNRPPTRVQQRSIISMKRVNTFVDYRTELMEESSKKAEAEIAHESNKEKVALDTIPLALSIADRSSKIPVEDLDLVLYGDLKTMFEPHVEDNVWKNQSDYRVLDWKLYDSCGVHSLRKQNVHIHMLVEKRYPLTAPTITDMLNKKLQADHFSEMAYQLLKLLTKQLKNQ
ncbi:hypothetical protein Tco_1062813, partial [Tanacetum coccineum]